MTKLIYRKLSYDIFSFFLLSSFAITLIVWVVQGVNLLDLVSEQGHGLKVYFFYTSLNIPKIFSKLLIFTYFITLFVIITRYNENNEILVFWTNGIKKISFINFIGKLSIIFVIIQIFLNVILVPYTQNLKQEYLKNSSIEFFPTLVQEKRFSDISRDLTIFVEQNNNGNLKGIYIKEKISDNENKIIVASEGILNKQNDNFNFKLFNGSITNIDIRGSISIKFKETTYELSKLNSKTRQESKLNETKSNLIFSCLAEFFKNRKDDIIRCGETNEFLIKDIYEEAFKRIIIPVYLIILSLISSLLILKPKDIYRNYYKFFLFILGFAIILFSELSYKFILMSLSLEISIMILPLIFIFCFYIILLIKSKFKLRYL